MTEPDRTALSVPFVNALYLSSVPNPSSSPEGVVPFTRSPVSGHPSLIVSSCQLCQGFVGASPVEKLLDLVEETHRCQLAQRCHDS